MAAVSKILWQSIGLPTTIATGDTVTADGVWTFPESVVISQNLTVNGTTTTINSQLATADRFMLSNASYTTNAALTAGTAFNLAPFATSFSVATVSNAGLAAAGSVLAADSGFTTTTDPTATLAIGDIILVATANDPSNDGLFEVKGLSSAPNQVAIKTAPDASVSGIVNTAVTTDAAAGGTLVQTEITVMRADSTGGTVSIGNGSATPLAFAAIGTSGSSTLQAAYIAGETITVDTTNGTFAVTGTPDQAQTVETITGGVHTGAIAENLVSITSDDQSTGYALQINNIGSGNALDIQDAGVSVFTVNGAGAITATPTSGQNATITAAGAGAVNLTAGTGGMDFTSTGNIAITAPAASTTAWVIDDGTTAALTLNSTSAQLEQGMFLSTGVNIGEGLAYANNSGATIVAGTMISTDTNTTLQIVESDATGAGATNLLSRVAGVVKADIATGASGQVHTAYGAHVSIRFTGAVATSDIGKMSYLDTSGLATLTAPSTSGDFITEVGIVQGANAGAGTVARVQYTPRFVAAIA